ncbi:MAG: tetratricopeptide repeat protein [Acidobacteria bacterium]|nr:tetratricopeptide repeat protein [Acidobacteriota bacterium]
MMNGTTRTVWCTLLLVGLLGISTAACQKLKARDQLNKGVQAYKAAKYQVAIEYFKTAVDLDPQLLNARLYLATAYANQFVPGSEAEENLKIGEEAIAQFQKVLETDPNNVGSIGGIANLYFQMKRMDDAKEFYRRQISLDPANPEAYYSVGVIDWTLTYQPRMFLKTRLKLRPEDPIKDAKERQALAERNAPLVDEGMQMLNKAIELRPDYDDAMAYLNLLYREKADLAETEEERQEHLKVADMWIDKTMEIKKQKAQKSSSSGQG